MSNPAIPGPSFSTTGLDSPPPMPSIVASALLESRTLVTLTRRAVVTWLTRG